MRNVQRRIQTPTKARTIKLSTGAMQCRRKFLRFFPGGFWDKTYDAWERDYKWTAHARWTETLNITQFRQLLDAGDFDEIAARAIRIESRTNLLFSFEKMALRDAVRSPEGAKAFATGLYDWLHGAGSDEQRFERWIKVVSELPRKQTRVLTWPIVTVFGFLADPTRHIFLKPVVTRIAAETYGVPFGYDSAPNWETYSDVLAFAHRITRDQRDLKAKDLIDAQSFMWVQGSAEYAE